MCDRPMKKGALHYTTRELSCLSVSVSSSVVSEKYKMEMLIIIIAAKDCRERRRTDITRGGRGDDVSSLAPALRRPQHRRQRLVTN